MFIQKPFSLTSGAASGDAAYIPNGSIWFDRGNSYLTRTPGSAGNRKTFSLSCWVKMATLDANQTLWDAAPSGQGNEDMFLIRSDNIPEWMGAGTTYSQATRVMRDPTAWYHILFVQDTTSDVADQRALMWINGEYITNQASSTLSLNADATYWNNTNLHSIGNRQHSSVGPSSRYGGYLSEAIQLDGYAAIPTDFGKFNSNGVWVPIDPTDIVTANKGTNGFWLDFADSSNLGNDVSYSGLSVGTDNSWTTTSITAANSSLDRPADDADTDVGNYCTISTMYTREVNNGASPVGAITTSKGALTVDFANSGSTNPNPLCITTQPLLPGNKYHFEWESNAWGSDATQPWAGVWLIPLSSLYTVTNINASGGYAWYISTWTPNRGIGSNTAFNGSTLSSLSSSDAWTVGAIMSVDIDMSTIGSTDIISKKDGTTIATDSSLAFLDEPYFICPQVQSNGANRTWNGTFNFGQHTFSTTPETDHGRVLTTRIAEPTVKNGETHFLPMIYDGNGSSQRVGDFIPFTDSHTVNNSARFDDADSNYLSRTFVTPTSAYKWTFSTWFKRGKLGDMTFIGQGDYNAQYTALYFNGSNQFQFQERGSGVWNLLLTSNRQFTDTSSWHHLVVAYDTATSTTATKVYIDGREITSWSATTYPGSTNTASSWNSAGTAWIGEVPVNTPGYYMDGYLAETMFVDGYALAASVFGQTDTSTNRWIPKEVTTATINAAGGGSSGWGNNGFYLAYGAKTALGTDTSGEGHDWTMNNMDASGGNQMYDTPTRNTAIIAPDAWIGTGGAGFNSGGLTISEGNLTAAVSSSSIGAVSRGWSNWGVQSGKWYFENTITVKGVWGSGGVGIASAYNSNDVTNGTSYYWQNQPPLAINYYAENNNGGTQQIRRNVDNSNSIIGTQTITAGDTMALALDLDSNPATVKYYYNNTLKDTYTIPTQNLWWIPITAYSGTGTSSYNFGQWVRLNSVDMTYNSGAGGNFRYTPPTGHKALNQDNLPAQTGNITGFSWIKNRDATDSHILQDRVRGATNYVVSNDTDLTATNANSVQKFLQQGVQIGNMDAVNTDVEGYVLWQWAANGTGTLNEEGSIDSTVSANTDASFSVVKYTGTGSAATVGHGLSTAPSFILNKTLASGTDNNWIVYHSEVGATKAAFLNLNLAPVTGSGYWNDVAPTATVFSIGTDRDSAVDYINYCWAEVEGYSKFGSFTGNNSSDGPFIYMPFSPSYFMFKRTDGNGDWYTFDSTRSPYNPATNLLAANQNKTESTMASDSTNGTIDFLSNGIKFRSGNGSDFNGSGATFIYAAWAEHPFGGSGVAPATAR
jgi:hypothetical protein